MPSVALLNFIDQYGIKMRAIFPKIGLEALIQIANKSPRDEHAMAQICLLIIFTKREFDINSASLYFSKICGMQVLRPSRRIKRWINIIKAVLKHPQVSVVCAVNKFGKITCFLFVYR